MDHTSYLQRREQIEHYFDRTAAKAWEVLTSNAPVGRIRRTVREGRDQMRSTLMSWLPQDMRGMRLLEPGWKNRTARAPAPAAIANRRPTSSKSSTPSPS